ncbi:MAG TPA: amidase [Polyangiaceae bacterium]|nr:amidase [Polyangiaceae bacterium]
MKRAALFVCLATACADPESTETTPTPPPSIEPVDPQDYLDRSLREQVEVMETRALSSAGLTAAYFERAETRDRGPNGIRAIIAVDPAAADAAASLDDERGQGALLQGAVLFVKDNIDSAGLANTAGSIALADNVPMADAPVIARLRQANALVAAKTNLSEWANFRGYQSTSGWSSLGGQTLNGANPAYNPCGSSSGSGAAVAAGLASAALGTETDGSIVCPAAVNGVVGFKPTVGLVSRSGVIPISRSQDTVGPITKNVADAARLMRVMAGADPNDPATSAIPADLDLDFEAPLEKATLAGARLGVVESHTGYHAGLDQVFNAELARIEAAGATLVVVTLPTSGAYSNDELTVLLHEFKVDLEAYLAAHMRPAQPTTLAELIAFNEANAATVMPHFGQELFEQAELTTGLDAPAYLAAKESAQRVTGEEGIDAVMLANDLDALLAPTTGPAWVTNYATGDKFSGSVSGPPAVAGYPHLTVPMGSVDGLPVGLSFIARRWQDGTVLALGHAYESINRR